MPKLLLLAAAIPLFLYVSICLAGWALQDKVLFPVGAASAHGPLPSGAERLEMVAADGTKLVGVHLPPQVPTTEAPVILGFGGNAWNADNAGEYLADVFPGTDVIVFHYRGYAPSGGRPGAAALLADSLLVHDEAIRLFPGRRIVAVGFSIGSGLAAHVARARPVAGAILVTPFDSLTEVAAGQFPWLPVRLLFRNPIDAARDLAEVKAPVAILAGDADTLIPAARTDGLRRAARSLIFDRTIEGAGHNDIYGRSSFQQAAREALRAVLAARP
jgi:pimeloyl-ACP methyl ester carboxylesterase